MATKRKQSPSNSSTVIFRNGKALQIQSLVETMGNLRQEVGTGLGEVHSGLAALTKSFDEFKNRTQWKVDEHEQKISKAEGGLTAWKWIAGTGGFGLLLDGLAHIRAFFKP